MYISVYIAFLLQKQGKAFKIPFSITRIWCYMTTKQSKIWRFVTFLLITKKEEVVFQVRGDV